ncbi:MULTISPECIES: BrnT family toxin [unclassified Leptospira]|uniref:BrnT family toxin n=1 Tax=unclassified Leptospira TaxID=2633828 RepID=UPI0002BE1061|nr:MULTISPECIES: BrnT family toxin [unclassified Leptospira]EMK01442.1 PF04365 family protein [Leptospira sp. B5-022]MCR1795808.1 BrnT family toxin [Leptospira sp. id769339]
MRFEWDIEKEKVNIQKHNLSFGEASLVFADPKAIYLPDPDHSVGELREIALGKIVNITIAVVIFVDRSKNGEEIIRIVSARRATKSEEIQYYSNDIN